MWEPKRGSLKSAGKQQESALSCILFVAVQLLVKKKSAVRFLQRNFPKIAAQLLFFTCGMLQGWGLEGWGLGVAD